MILQNQKVLNSSVLKFVKSIGKLPFGHANVDNIQSDPNIRGSLRTIQIGFERL